MGETWYRQEYESSFTATEGVIYLTSSRSGSALGVGSGDQRRAPQKLHRRQVQPLAVAESSSPPGSRRAGIRIFARPSLLTFRS